MNLKAWGAQWLFGAVSLISFSANCVWEKEKNITVSSEYSEEINLVNVLSVQTSLLNSLKGVTALQINYRHLKNPTHLQNLEKHIGIQEFQADSSNLEEALDGAALVVIKKLEEYERLLLQLIKKIDTISHNTVGDQQNIKSLDKTLEQHWSEFKGTLIDWDAEFKEGLKKGGLVTLVLCAWPYSIVKAKDGLYGPDGSRINGIRNFVLNLIIAVPGSLIAGGLLDLVLKKLSSYVYEQKSEEYNSEALHKLYKQLEIVAGVEELFNATLIYQKHRELREQRFLALGD